MQRPKLPRLTDLLLISVVLFVACYFAQDQVPGTLLAVSIYKAHMASLAGWIGYWLDRSLFPYSRPHELLHDAEDVLIHGSPEQAQDGDLLISGCCDQYALYNKATLRRAIIVAACVIGICLGA